MCVCIRTSEVRDRLNMVRRRCAEMTVLSSKESANRPTADNVRTWAESLDLLLADKCQSDIHVFLFVTLLLMPCRVTCEIPF